MACVFECVSHVQAHQGPAAAHEQGETRAQAVIGCCVHICRPVRLRRFCGSEPKNGPSCRRMKGPDTGARGGVGVGGKKDRGGGKGEHAKVGQDPHPAPPSG